MRVAVTGANGHVGVNLVDRLLAEGVEVRAFDAGGFDGLANKPVEHHPGDVRDATALDRCFAGVDVVFHLAALISIYGDRGGLVYDVNVGGARTAARAALAAGVRRFVHLSSIQAFDTRGVEGRVDESWPRSIGSDCHAYDRSKALGEAEVRRTGDAGLDVVVLHPTAVVGPRDTRPSRLGKTLLDAARGRLPVLVDGGFDLVDVRDVADAAWNAALRGKRGQAYILSGTHTTMIELTRAAARRSGALHPVLSLPLRPVRGFAPLARLLAQARGQEPLFTEESLDLLATRARFSHERATRELGFSARPLETTVSDLVDSFVAAGWVGPKPAPPPLRSRFALQLRDHPVDAPQAQRVLQRVLEHIAMADGRIDPAEQHFLERFGKPDPDLPERPPAPCPADVAALGAGNRESIWLLAAALALADQDLTGSEREALDAVAEELRIPPTRRQELEAAALEFVIDELFDSLYADGVLDAEEEQHLEHIATALDVSPRALQRADVRARSRHGLRAAFRPIASPRAASGGESEVAGTTCVVTGASAGIGQETALGLARLGAQMILVCRNPGRGKRAVERILAESGNPSIELLLADLSSQAEIRRLAAEILERCPRLDVLVNNAGVLNVERELTVDGREATFAVNHLAYFLLTRLLLDRLVSSGPSRIVNVASVAHWWGRLDLADPDSERRYHALRAYGTSKLANVVFTRELARRLEGLPVTANCVHPGLVPTQLGRNNGAYARAMNRVLGSVFSSPAQGAQTLVWAATAAELDDVSGAYLVDRRAALTSRQARDPALAAGLWTLSSRLTGLPDHL